MRLSVLLALLVVAGTIESNGPAVADAQQGTTASVIAVQQAAAARLDAPAAQLSAMARLVRARCRARRATIQDMPTHLPTLCLCNWAEWDDGFRACAQFHL
jgi:hypothetical protein